MGWKLSVLSFLFFSSSVRAGASFESSDRQVALIELFSSEGCSSCPPADEWMAQLRREPGLWKDFVPVEFHVDYWNRLGWLDPFSKTAFTDRQHRYAEEWGKKSVYTPGFVLNGEEWKANVLGGRNAPSPGAAVGILKVKEKTKRVFEVTFHPKAPEGVWMAACILLGNGLVSRITSGENGGKTLTHEFVALGMDSNPLVKGGKDFSATLDVSAPLKMTPKSLSLAVWVWNSKSLRPIQATGGDL